ncbi:MAG TPA: hypothetical protein VNK94_01460, partial [Gaiellaceae bacterium]|nr:hypothetical protein [Gaiellaceae bacterium]
MGLTLVVGPAHAGKVALLLERYLDCLEQDPWLVVPTRAEVERVERDLLRRRPALLAGRIGTFDDLFAEVASAGPDERGIAAESQRALAVRRAIARTPLDGLAASATSGGFADSLLGILGELESALVDPDRIGGDLGRLARGYREELERLGLRDRDGLRRRAVERLAGDLAAWDGRPVFAYGFEDLTAAEWGLVEALAGRAQVTISIPYEPGRAAFSALERTVGDLAALAGGSVLELPPQAGSRDLPAALAHLERELFRDAPPPGPALDGALRFLEGAGTRGTLELVGSEVLEVLGNGTPAERIGLVCDSVERWRAALECVLGALGIPFALEHEVRLGETALGRALLSLLRFAWAGGGREDLFAFLRAPFSGLERRSVDFVEGRLRGRAIREPGRVEQETERLRGAPVPALRELRAGPEPVGAARAVLRLLLRNAWGLTAPPLADDARADARAFAAAERTLDELAELARLDGRPPPPEEVLGALERSRVGAVAAREPGRVAVLDYERARTRSFEVVFLLGLEEGALPRRDRPSPLLDDAARRELGGRLERPDPVARDRYLFYTACTRARSRLVLVREAAGDDGVPQEPSPFWDDVRALF